MMGIERETVSNPIAPWVTPYVTYILENGIVAGTYKKGLTVDFKMAQEIVAHRLKVFDGKSYPALADVRSIKLVTKEARDYFAKEGTRQLTALAILTGNYFTVAISNFFIKFSKPKIPTRMFKTKEGALKWLEQFVKEQ